MIEQIRKLLGIKRQLIEEIGKTEAKIQKSNGSCNPDLGNKEDRTH